MRNYFARFARVTALHVHLPGYIEMKARYLSFASFSVVAADTCADEERFFSYRRNTLRKLSCRRKV